MVHIKKIKLFNGELRYAVVEPFTSTIVVKEGKEKKAISKTEDLVVEYKSGDKVFPAIFPVTAEGLEKAKEIQTIFKKKKK
jgi:hypothetical protein